MRFIFAIVVSLFCSISFGAEEKGSAEGNPRLVAALKEAGYELEKPTPIGTGYVGVVYKIRDSITGERFVLKIPNLGSPAAKEPENLASTLRDEAEFPILFGAISVRYQFPIHYPSTDVVPLPGLFDTEVLSFGIIKQYISGKSLASILSSSSLDTSLVIQAQALYFWLIEANLWVKDLHGENIVFNREDGAFYIIDCNEVVELKSPQEAAFAYFKEFAQARNLADPTDTMTGVAFRRYILSPIALRYLQNYEPYQDAQTIPLAISDVDAAMALGLDPNHATPKGGTKPIPLFRRLKEANSSPAVISALLSYGMDPFAVDEDNKILADVWPLPSMYVLSARGAMVFREPSDDRVLSRRNSGFVEIPGKGGARRFLTTASKKSGLTLTEFESKSGQMSHKTFANTNFATLMNVDVADKSFALGIAPNGHLMLNKVDRDRPFEDVWSKFYDLEEVPKAAQVFAFKGKVLLFCLQQNFELVKYTFELVGNTLSYVSEATLASDVEALLTWVTCPLPDDYLVFFTKVGEEDLRYFVTKDDAIVEPTIEQRHSKKARYTGSIAWAEDYRGFREFFFTLRDGRVVRKVFKPDEHLRDLFSAPDAIFFGRLDFIGHFIDEYHITFHPGGTIAIPKVDENIRKLLLGGVRINDIFTVHYNSEAEATTDALPFATTRKGLAAFADKEIGTYKSNSREAMFRRQNLSLVYELMERRTGAEYEQMLRKQVLEGGRSSALKAFLDAEVTDRVNEMFQAVRDRLGKTWEDVKAADLRTQLYEAEERAQREAEEARKKAKKKKWRKYIRTAAYCVAGAAVCAATAYFLWPVIQKYVVFEFGILVNTASGSKVVIPVFTSGQASGTGGIIGGIAGWKAGNRDEQKGSGHDIEMEQRPSHGPTLHPVRWEPPRPTHVAREDSPAPAPAPPPAARPHPGAVDLPQVDPPTRSRKSI